MLISKGAGAINMVIVSKSIFSYYSRWNTECTFCVKNSVKAACI